MDVNSGYNFTAELNFYFISGKSIIKNERISFVAGALGQTNKYS
jgi:hypothetical protein